MAASSEGRQGIIVSALRPKCNSTGDADSIATAASLLRDEKPKSRYHVTIIAGSRHSSSR